VLAKERPDTKIVVSEPADAAMLTSGVEQKRREDGSASESHPSFNPHPIQGWSPDFIPKITGDAVAMDFIHEVQTVSGPEAMKASRDLATQEGIFCGISCGATFATALEVCKTAPEGSNILCMLPDTGERYLSTPLFAEIEAEMNDAELEISMSTDGYQRPNPA
jgi:cysteine synthase A